jgi:hypothetical protein
MNRPLAGRWLAPFIALTILTGCGAPSTNQPARTSIRPDPTSTATPVSASSGPPPTATPLISDQVLLNLYTHSSERFSISYPANWRYFEQPNGVVILEPGDQAGYSVIFSDAGETYSDEELNQYLVTFVAQNFVEEGSGFSARSQERQANGTVVAQFATVDPNLGPMINEVRVWQQDTIVMTVLLSVSEDQWENSQAGLYGVVDTLVLLDSSPLAQVTPTKEPPIWDLIGSTNQAFGFFIPSDWHVVEQDEEHVRVKMPDLDVTFEGSVFDWPGAKDNPTTAAEEAALAYLKNLSQEHEQVLNQPLTEFPLDETTGATIDFLYITKEGAQFKGSIITAASEGKIYQIVFSSPAAIYEQALEWFNPMYKSFKILEPEQ